MKKYLYQFFAFGALLLLGASCDEENAALTTLETVRFSSQVQASPSTMVLTSDNKSQSVTTLSWQHVGYPIDAPVTYTLQFDTPADTIGGWQNAVRIPVGEDVLSKSFIGSDLNDMAKDLGLVADVSGQLVVRVEAYMDRAVYSEAIVLTVTPFTPQVAFGQLYMPGSYNGFDSATANVLSAIDSGIYQGYLTFPAGQLQFNFTTERTGGVTYGADSSGNFSEGGSNNFSVPSAGSYQITVNLNTMSYTAVPYSWGIIGTATLGGWDADTDMSYDYLTGEWTYTGQLVPGALKYRLNDAWTINYGQNTNADPVVYLNNQGAYTITEAGLYKVTFKVNPDPATANYSVTRL